jgi:hypothetical protein
MPHINCTFGIDEGILDIYCSTPLSTMTALWCEVLIPEMLTGKEKSSVTGTFPTR